MGNIRRSQAGGGGFEQLCVQPVERPDIRTRLSLRLCRHFGKRDAGNTQFLCHLHYRQANRIVIDQSSTASRP